MTNAKEEQAGSERQRLSLVTFLLHNPLLTSFLMIQVTEPAIRQLQVMLREQDDQTKGLRIFVENGGCAGLQYGMGFAHAEAGDEVVERDGVKVIIAEQSRQFLNGSTIDYSDDLAGAGFRIQNPNAVRSCGCGTSFEPAGTEASSQH